MNSRYYSIPYWFIVAFLIFSGCHGQLFWFEKTPSARSDKNQYEKVEQPLWFEKTPVDDLYYYGSGMSSTMEDAEEKARANLIKAIEVRVESEIMSIEVSRGEGTDEDVHAEFITRSRSYATQEKLPNLQIVERHVNQPKYYALARLEKKVVRDLLKEAGEDCLRDVKDRIKHGNTALNNGNIVRAAKEYEKAEGIADTLPRSYRETPEGHPDGTTWEVVIERKLQYICDYVRIETVSGNEQIGRYGKPLTTPLIVRIRCADALLRGFPLMATYTRGTGRLRNSRGETGESIRIYTDVDGEGICWVDAVESISQENYIQITPDEESIPLPESTFVTFSYRSVFPEGNAANAPQVLLNGSSREQEISERSPVDIEIHLTGDCFVHFFGITADGNLAYIKSSNRINKADSGERWSVVSPKKSSNPAKWVFKIKYLTLHISAGLGLETLLVVTTMVEWTPTGETLTTEGLIQQLNEIDENNWSADSVSYRIVPTIQ